MAQFAATLSTFPDRRNAGFQPADRSHAAARMATFAGPFESVDKSEWKTGNGKPGTENWAMLMQKGRFSIFGFRFPVFHSPSDGRPRENPQSPLGGAFDFKITHRPGRGGTIHTGVVAFATVGCLGYMAPMQRGDSRWRVASPLAVIACCIVVPCVWWSWKLGPMQPGGTVTFLNYDQYQYTLPDWEFAARMLRQGTLPLWNPYQLSGTPYLATQHPGILYPPNWLILFWSVPVVMRVLTLAHYALAMGGAYWCARAFGCSRAAALLAGTSYAFSGRLSGIGVVTNPTVLVSVAWLPWQLGLTRAVLRAHCAEWQWLACALAVAMSMTVLGGHPQYALLSAQLCGAYALAHVAWRARGNGTRGLLGLMARLGLAAAVAVGVSAIQLLPTVELMLRSTRRAGVLESLSGNNPFAFLLPPEQLLRNLLFPIPGEFGLAGAAYMGTAVVVLAAVPLFWRGTRRRSVFLAGTAAIAALIALGDHTPLYSWYLHLPGSGLFRVPQRVILVATLCVALLGALGATVLSRRSSSPRGNNRWIAIGVMPLLTWLALQWISPGWQGPSGASVIKLYAPLLMAVGMATMLCWYPRRMGRQALVLLIAALSVYESYHGMQLLLPVPANHPDALQVPRQAAAIIRERQGFARTFAPNRVEYATVPHVPPKLGMLTSLWLISDDEPLIDARYARLLGYLMSDPRRPDAALMGELRVDDVAPRQWPLLRLLGVGFVLVRRDAHIGVPGLKQLYSDDLYDVHVLDQPLPRAYVARAVRVTSTPEAALHAVVHETDFILGGGAVVEQPLVIGADSDGSVDITDYAAHQVGLHVRLSQPGLVVLQDQFDPYWTATVDGQPTAIVRANYVFRGVVVAAGEHVVRFVYRPILFYVGAALSAFTLSGLLLLAIRSTAR